MVLPILTKEGEEESKVPSIVPPQTLPGMGGPKLAQPLVIRHFKRCVCLDFIEQ